MDKRSLHFIKESSNVPISRENISGDQENESLEIPASASQILSESNDTGTSNKDTGTSRKDTGTSRKDTGKQKDAPRRTEKSFQASQSKTSSHRRVTKMPVLESTSNFSSPVRTKKTYSMKEEQKLRSTLQPFTKRVISKDPTERMSKFSPSIPIKKVDSDLLAFWNEKKGLRNTLQRDIEIERDTKIKLQRDAKIKRDTKVKLQRDTKVSVRRRMSKSLSPNPETEETKQQFLQDEEKKSSEGSTDNLMQNTQKTESLPSVHKPLSKSHTSREDITLVGPARDEIKSFQKDTGIISTLQRRLEHILERIFPDYNGRKKMYNLFLALIIISWLIIICSVIASAILSNRYRIIAFCVKEKKLCSEGPSKLCSTITPETTSFNTTKFIIPTTITPTTNISKTTSSQATNISKTTSSQATNISKTTSTQATTISATTSTQAITTARARTSTVTATKRRRSSLSPKAPGLLGPTLYQGVCKTEACNEAVTRMKRNMDKSVNPCDNFFKFACGKWEDFENLTSNMFSKSIVDVIVKEQKLKIKELIDLQNRTLNASPQYIRKLLFVYNSCKDNKNKENEKSSLTQKLNDLGYWPLKNQSWNKEKFSLIETLVKISKLGFDATSLINIKIIPNELDKLLMISIEMPRYSMNQSFYSTLTLDHQKEYEIEIKKIAKIIPGTWVNRTEEMVKMYRFEKGLYDVFAVNGTRSYKTEFLHVLANDVKGFDWKEYFSKLLNGYNINLNELRIRYPDGAVMQNLTNLISKTEIETVANYIIWRAIRENARLINRYDRDEIIADSDRCYNFIIQEMNIVVTSLYVNQQYKISMRQSAFQVASYIQYFMANQAINIPWIIPDLEVTDIKDKAAEKIKKTILNYPAFNETWDELEMNKYTQRLNTSSNFFENALNLNKWKLDIEFRKIGKTQDRYDWTYNVAEQLGNLYYVKSQNRVVFGLAFSEIPFFHQDLPNYMNFAGAGNRIARELINGISEDGSSENFDGRKFNWWNQPTRMKYKNLETCITTRYKIYTFPDRSETKLNTEKTKTEDIADVGGFKAAYKAYESWEKEHGAELTLNDFYYTAKQIFWINLANTFCSLYNYEKNATVELEKSKFSPWMFRVNGPLSMIQEFSEDFHCTLNDNMNYNPKCSVF